jgi:integrase
MARKRIHDIRHTFGQRLRDAGVSDKDRALLLDHAVTQCEWMTGAKSHALTHVKNNALGTLNT